MNNKIDETNFNIAGKLANGFMNHPLTFIFAIFILFIGYLSLEITPREENPQIKVSGGAIIIPLPGAKASEVEKVIIEPLERKIREISGVENIYGIAKDNVAILQIQFYIGQDKAKSDLKLYDKIQRNLDVLPKGIMTPIIKTMDIDTDIPIATIAFYAKDKNLSETELYKKVVQISHEVSKIDNVALTDLKGERKEQYNISVDLNKLSGYHISMGQVVKAIEGLSFNLPDVKGRNSNGEIILFGIEQAINSAKDIENIMIANYMGSPVYLKNIASIKRGNDIQSTKKAYFSYQKNGLENKIPQTTLTISKLKGSNAVIINNEIFAYLDSIKDDLAEAKIGYIITRDDGYKANHAVNELMFHLVISVIIIAILLIVALGFKEAIIVSLTVPMILALTLFIGYMLGETINRITLFALLLSLGLLVDAAIIVIENIHRNMHDEKNYDKDLEVIAIEATNEIGNPTNIATLAIIMTFVPMFFVGGMMGQFMHPLPVFVPISLIVSLFVAYIFTPYLVKKILKK